MYTSPPQPQMAPTTGSFTQKNHNSAKSAQMTARVKNLLLSVFFTLYLRKPYFMILT